MQERMTALESNCKIELVNVTKRFGKVIANDSVNLTIEGGKVLCLLGENGSGKTTLDRKSTRLNSSHASKSRMPSSA